MIITYHGKQFFKIQYGELVVAVNPLSKDSTAIASKVARFGADVALSSINHPDYKGIDTVTLGSKTPFIIDGPGEYEVSGILIQGFLTSTAYQGMTINTLYNLEIDDIRICFAGALSSPDLAQDVKEGVGDIDIAFVPIGGKGVLDSLEAARFAKWTGAKLIIPMDYEADQDNDSLQTFLKELGSEGLKPEPKLTIKKKDLPATGMNVALLSYE